MAETGKISHTDRAAFTAAYMATVVPNSVEAVGGLRCTCSERPWPHPAHVEEEAVFEYHRSLRQDRETHVRKRAVSASTVSRRRPQPIQRQRAQKRGAR